MDVGWLVFNSTFNTIKVTASGVVLKIKVGIRCKQCGRGAVGARRRLRREDSGADGGVVWGVPRKCFAFGSQNGEFWCILGHIFTVELLVYRLRKTEELGCFN